LPPAKQLRAEVAILRRIAPDDASVRKLCDAFEAVDEMLAAGYTVREGGGEQVKPRPMLPEWKKEPPETP
jgi:hypothetical protein